MPARDLRCAGDKLMHTHADGQQQRGLGIEALKAHHEACGTLQGFSGADEVPYKFMLPLRHCKTAWKFSQQQLQHLYISLLPACMAIRRVNASHVISCANKAVVYTQACGVWNPHIMLVSHMCARCYPVRESLLRACTVIHRK